MASSSIIEPEGAARSPEWCPLVSQRLREARMARDLTLRSLASQIGVSASLISQIETGKVQPSVNTLYALAIELELSLDELLFPTDTDGDAPADHPEEDDPPLVERAGGAWLFPDPDERLSSKTRSMTEHLGTLAGNVCPGFPKNPSLLHGVISVTGHIRNRPLG